MHTKTIREHGLSLRKKEYSSVELTQHFLDRIHKSEDLNAFITVLDDEAIKQAKAADDKISRGDETLLNGIPVAHKDLFCIKDVLTTCGSKILHNFKSPYDAAVVDRLNRQGMVILGKTNMDEFAMGSSNENSYFGSVANPWDKIRVPGGSSGGSASAVAARLTPAATATDTGGSIRQPAAFCGLTGIKPSYGRVSRYGMIAFASSFDQGGVLAANTEDTAILLQAMAGFDPRDSTSLELDVPDYINALDRPIEGRVIGLPEEFFSGGVDQQVALAIQDAVKQLESLGAKTVAVKLPNTAAAIPCYYVLAPAEASSNLSRFDGIRYGYRAREYDDLTDMYEKTRTEGFGDEVKRRLMIGTYVLSSGYYDAYYIKAQKLRRLISDDFNRAFEKCDLILGPTTPGTAFAAGEKNDDPVAMYLNDIFTTSANLAGLPAISLAAGFDKNGLPIGMHLIGKYLDEAALLNVGHQYQKVTEWHKCMPAEYR